jgi:hypothetical protein
MTRDLAARVAAAQAEADADSVARCKWCGAPADVAELTIAEYERSGTITECVNASMCHHRFEAGLEIVVSGPDAA